MLLWYRSKEGTTWIFTSSPTPTRCCCNFLGPQKDVGEGSCACATQAGKHLSLDQSRQFNSVDSQTVLISPRFFRLLFISLMEIGGALLSLTLQVRWRLCSKYFFFKFCFSLFTAVLAKIKFLKIYQSVSKIPLYHILHQKSSDIFILQKVSFAIVCFMCLVDWTNSLLDCDLIFSCVRKM